MSLKSASELLKSTITFRYYFNSFYCIFFKIFFNIFVLLYFCTSGDTLGSFVYVPCEVMKQRMQVQGTQKSWNSVMLRETVPHKQMYCYYSGMFQAGCSIFREHGLKGLYAG